MVALAFGLLLLACADKIEPGCVDSRCATVTPAPSTGDASGGEGCSPTDPVCYVSGPEGPGAECLAVRDNTDQKRVQLRQTWSRSTLPAGVALPATYKVLQSGSELRLSECNMFGTSSFIQLIDIDRTSDDPSHHTLTTGFAPRVDDARQAIRDGLCFAQFQYDDPQYRLSQAQIGSARGAPQPWAVTPVVFRREMADFEVRDLRSSGVPEGQGVYFQDPVTHAIHAYAPRVYVLIFESEQQVLAPPLHDVEIHSQPNDASMNCIGAYRAGALSVADGCFSDDQLAPPWGCNDGDCPVGESSHVTTGYFLITEMEQVYSSALLSTLCVNHPTQEVSKDEGWADPSTWGLNCRGSPKWNPSDATSGLPRGDWCSATNEPWTSDCHDAYRSVTYMTFAGFPVRDTPCDLGTLPIRPE